MRIEPLWRFIQERWAIYQRRQTGQPKPWTSDPILRRYRFTNVYRERDKVTAFIREHWREPNATDPSLWFAMVVARLLNLPVSLQALGYPVPWCPDHFKTVMRTRKEAGVRIFGAAYMVRADAVKTGLKTDYLADYVLTPLWKEEILIRPMPGDTLAKFFARLTEYRDMGGFMAAQVIADVKNTDGQMLYEARDWWRWAASGPGSRRGLNRLLRRGLKTPWIEAEWLYEVNRVQAALAPLLKKANMPRMCAQDTQNCLCEFDKYERVRRGEGRPKQLYTGA